MCRVCRFLVADFDDMTATMKRCAALLRDAEIEHALSGSMAAWAHGGPPVSGDVDFIVRPADAERALQVLADAGLRPERPPEGWLLKAHDGDVMVDLIFEPTGLDIEQALARAGTLSVLSVDMKVATVDDILITKLLAFEEHYIDFVGLLPIARALREQADWPHVQACTSHSAIAVGFFAMADALEIIAPGGAARQQRIRVSTA
jgi:hypothetical protein